MRPLTTLPAQLLLAASLSACVAAPALERTTAEVRTSPAGARCVTAEGEVYLTPASIPCPPGGVLHLEVELDGHVDRRVELMTGPPRPRLRTLFLGELMRGFAGDEWERVEARDGRALLVLQPVSAVDHDDVQVLRAVHTDDDRQLDVPRP